MARTGRSSLWLFFLGMIPAYIVWWFAWREARKTAEQLAMMPADALLAADSANFEIGYDDIKSIEMKGPFFPRRRSIRIATATTLHKFLNIEKGEFEAGRAALPRVLGKKLKLV